MGFFDNFVDENASTSSTSGSSSTGSSSGASSGGATAVAESPKKISLKKTDESDFLIIDDSVTIDSIPNTASDIFISDAAPEKIEPVSDAEIIINAEPVVEIETSTEVDEVVEADTVIEPEVIPEITVSDVSEPVIVELPTVEEEEVSTPETFFMASAADEILSITPSEASSEIDSSETAVRQAMEKITTSIRAKENERDAKIAENERILAQIADLKKQAKTAQDEAREIDKSADHDRKLVEGLKTLIAA